MNTGTFICLCSRKALHFSGRIIVSGHEKFSRPDIQIMEKQTHMENHMYHLLTSLSFISVTVNGVLSPPPNVANRDAVPQKNRSVYGEKVMYGWWDGCFLSCDMNVVTDLCRSQVKGLINEVLHYLEDYYSIYYFSSFGNHCLSDQ